MAPADKDSETLIRQRGFSIFGGFYTFRLIPMLITLILCGAMIALGVWQLQRLTWKTELIARMHERMEESEIDVGLSTILPESTSSMEYRPGRASGILQNNKPLYLNATSVGTGLGGYHILVPLLLEDGRSLLIDRGWMPYSLKDKFDGDTPQKRLYQPEGTIQLSGILRLPLDKKPAMRPANDPVKNDWYWMDMPAMASAMGVKEFLPYYLEANDDPHEGSYPVGGQTRMDIPNHHFQYAITWFWLAAILPFITFFSSWRKIRKVVAEEEKKEE